MLIWKNVFLFKSSAKESKEIDCVQLRTQKALKTIFKYRKHFGYLRVKVSTLCKYS